MILSLCPDVFFQAPTRCVECDEREAEIGQLCYDCFLEREKLREDERLETQLMERMGE